MIRRTPLDDTPVPSNVFTKLPDFSSDEVGVSGRKTVPLTSASSKIGSALSTDESVSILGSCIHDLGLELNEAHAELKFCREQYAQIKERSEFAQIRYENTIAELNANEIFYVARIHGLESVATKLAETLGKVAADLQQPIGEDIIEDLRRANQTNMIFIVNAYYMERDGELKIKYDSSGLE